MGQLPPSSAFTSQNFVHSSDVLTFGEGPEGHPIRRVPEQMWFLRNEASARVKNTEYCASFCRDNPREQLDEMLNMTYNDRRIQRETKVDIAQYPRNELHTALMGWGPRMRQIYVPELKAHTQELHERYSALGLPHEYHGDVQASSPVADKKGSLLQPRTAPATGNRRPGIKDLQDAGERSELMPGQPASPDRGSLSSSLQSTSFRPDGSANAAATEYRGQFCKNLSMQGTLERTQMFMDGAIDFDAPSHLQQTKRSIRLRQAHESHVVNNYKQMVYTKDEARRNNVSVDDVYKIDRFKLANDPYGLERNSTKRHRPPPMNAQESPRIPNIATLQKDLEWKPPGILQSLTGKAGPSEVTSQRTGFYGIQQAHSPRQTLRWGDTRSDRLVFKTLPGPRIVAAGRYLKISLAQASAESVAFTRGTAEDRTSPSRAPGRRAHPPVPLRFRMCRGRPSACGRAQPSSSCCCGLGTEIP